MPELKAHILVVDDEPKYIYMIKLNLEARDYEVSVAHNGEQAIALAMEKSPDLMILDIMMPGIDGYEVCHQVRQFSAIPIIMLTARVEQDHIVKGLDLGADDYITKPFAIEELIARVRANLRRVTLDKQLESTSMLQIGQLRIDLSSTQVFLNDKEIHLTNVEYAVLRELAENAGKVLLTEHLLRAVWGTDRAEDAQSLRQTVYRLRRKVEPDPKNPVYILTRSGLGYIFVAPDA